MSASVAAIRLARPEDFDDIRGITLAVYVGEGYAGEHYAPTLADVEHRYQATELLVAELAGLVVGSVAFVRHGGDYAEITAGPHEAAFRMLVVDPAARGHGIGELLVRVCIERARATPGVRRIAISTEASMIAAHRLYRRLGFHREPSRDWSPIEDVQLLCYTLELRP